MTLAGSPGTASDAYRATPVPHPWTPVLVDVYERSRCQHCPQPRHQHEEKRDEG